MRVLVVSNLFPPDVIGGYELGAYDVARKLSACHHEVCVATSVPTRVLPEDPHQFEIARVLECTDLTKPTASDETIRRDLYSNSNNVRSLINLIKRFSPDIALCFNLKGLGVLHILNIFDVFDLTIVWYIMDILKCSDITRKHFNQYSVLMNTESLFNKINFISPSSRLVEEFEADLEVSLRHVELIPVWFDKNHEGDVAEFYFRRYTPAAICGADCTA